MKCVKNESDLIAMRKLCFVGQEFKNYKALCEHLDIKVSTGEKKISQIKELERVFSFSKNGHRIIIEEIHKEIISNKCPIFSNGVPTSGLKGYYSPEGDRVALHCLFRLFCQYEGKTTIYTTPLSVAESMGFLNDNYRFLSNREKTHKIINHHWEEFNFSCGSTLMNNLIYFFQHISSGLPNSMLNRLQREGYISFLKDVYIIDCCRLADEYEVSEIENHEVDILGAMGLNSKRDLNSSLAIRKEYFELLKKRLKEEFFHGKSGSVFKGIQIIFKEKFLKLDVSLIEQLAESFQEDLSGLVVKIKRKFNIRVDKNILKEEAVVENSLSMMGKGFGFSRQEIVEIISKRYQKEILNDNYKSFMEKLFDILTNYENNLEYDNNAILRVMNKNKGELRLDIQKVVKLREKIVSRLEETPCLSEIDVVQ